MTVTFNITDLFGGAITVNVPTNFADVSKIRQVPDNQEVYLDKNGFTSLSFDITERVSHLSTDKDALNYHFNDIVAETDTKNTLSINESVKLPNFPKTTPILALTAITRPSASTAAANALTSTHTNIYFTLIRLVEQSTDIVISLNIPHLAGETEGHQSNGTEAGTAQRNTEQEAENMFNGIVTSFSINDWGLFSGE